jgi:hypothetical protein
MDDEVDDERITKIGLATEEITQARDVFTGHFLVYDENMERVPGDAQENVHAMAEPNDRHEWPPRRDWEEGEDPRRWTHFYDQGDDDLEDDEDEDAWRWIIFEPRPRATEAAPDHPQDTPRAAAEAGGE